MASRKLKPYTTGAVQFDPDMFFNSWPARPSSLFEYDNFRHAVITSFELPHNDSFIYHATASVSLAQVQQAISHGGDAGLHAWYLNEQGELVIISRQ